MNPLQWPISDRPNDVVIYLTFDAYDRVQFLQKALNPGDLICPMSRTVNNANKMQIIRRIDNCDNKQLPSHNDNDDLTVAGGTACGRTVSGLFEVLSGPNQV
ncbi:hypothetical protein GWI33_023225 [Rhynchophorus ferrugineus]|uniref:Uncharacterized protein n=1 Tax=Rhynchophorus ferrugineus TaxID=354439 RepID=A0A834HMK7_RHYFE|nr:hypothetical protein GWI33_023227 [Rhynchophorus ferrugineus]KAF7264429.1 hypothetical protein GWI33_023225 [Rhynchophorus ferrugineus]